MSSPSVISLHAVNLFDTIRGHVLAALRRAVADLPDALAARVEVTPAREAAHGDMATNAAMIAAKHARQAPAALAKTLTEALAGVPEVLSAEAAGPGFVNIRLRPEALRAVLPEILRRGLAYGDSTVGGGERVNVEYVSANPTGPMTVGHCRGTVVGDALANLLSRAGYAVTKEYYVNDAGAQVNALAWAVYWRYLQAIGTTLTVEEYAAQVPGGLQYPGDYLIPIGERLAAAHGTALASPDRGIAPPSVWLDLVRDFAISAMMEDIRADLAAIGVHQEVFTSERRLVESGAVDAAIARLAADGLIYEGVLEPPKGKTPEDWEPRPQTLFRATQFGDDVDRPLRKSDGSNTYFANDIAYHADKIARGERVLIDVVGADHGGYVKRMTAAVRALAPDVSFAALLCQIVHVVRNGQAVRMSKRAGTYETLRSLIEEVGRDAVRFTMLTRKPDAQMEFDLDQAVAQTRENPVFYVQYAHARCRSVLRAAAAASGAPEPDDAAFADATLDSLQAEPEMALIRRLVAWPRVLESAALAREPHRIAFFLYDLAADFHMLWNRGRDDATLRFLREDKPEETRARLALVAATAIVIRSGLAVMGVTPAEELRSSE
jgi:arginyl-tRNA synthetase